MRSDIVPGTLFPDYELTDHTAKRRQLSQLQGQHPMVLMLSRGGYCPKDRRQAELLVQLHPELEVGPASDRRRAGLINRGANDGALQRRRFLIAG